MADRDGRAGTGRGAGPADDAGAYGDVEVIDLPAGGATDAAGLASVDELLRSTSAGSNRPRRAAVGDGRQIVCEGLVRIYKVADLEVVALQGLDLVVNVGEMIAIVGASGSGKSTLLNILGGLDTPSAGRSVVAGHDLSQMGRRERTRYRRRVVGMIWQQTARNLLPYLTAQENVELPMTLDGRSKRTERARLLLELVGLKDRLDHRPERLSGGEQQRVAIAVALANEPEVLFADEPTGELDTTTSHEIFGLLRQVNEQLGTTIVIVTHDPLVSEQVQRTVAIRDGRTSTETVRRSSYSDTGEHTLISEEFAVLDRAGRLQLPKAQVAALGLRDRVRLLLVDDHVEIWPDTAVPGPVPARPAPGDGSRSITERAADDGGDR
jgi:ABC-type lipoprotein export system ATPase subunit